MLPIPIDFHKWLEENKGKLQPPVKNWCVHEGDDFIVMAVGGPNERSDYHVNMTEVFLVGDKISFLGMVLPNQRRHAFEDCR